MYIYLYIIYNIIKNKKRTHPQGYTHTEEKTDTQRKLRVAFLVKICSTVAVARILGATRNLQLCNFGCVLVSALYGKKNCFTITQLESE